MLAFLAVERRLAPFGLPRRHFGQGGGLGGELSNLTTTSTGVIHRVKGTAMRGLGRVFFVAILLLMAGTLNIVYGIAAVSNAHFFNGTQYPFASLHTWGWIGIIVGIIQLTGGISLIGGGGYGRFIGIFAATLGAIESLFAIGGQHPWWALGIFVVSLWVLHGLIVFSEDFQAQT